MTIRERWTADRRIRGWSNPPPHILLAEYGEDVTGGLSFSHSPELPPSVPVEADIPARIRALERDSDAWYPRDIVIRASLAGSQQKFPLRLTETGWVWPTHDHPSTHILKPPHGAHRHIEVLEAMCLNLARNIGIEAAEAEVIELDGHSVFVTKRWDRKPDGTRIDAIDLAQAMGVHPLRKSDVPAADVLRSLEPLGLAKDFVRQLAFNVAVGNSDAHLKNYSLVWDRAGSPRLAPLYDVIPIFLYPAYDPRLSMAIGGARRPHELTPDRWAKLAREAGMEEGSVVETARQVVVDVAERFEESFADVLPHDTNGLSKVRDHVRQLRQALAG